MLCGLSQKDGYTFSWSGEGRRCPFFPSLILSLFSWQVAETIEWLSDYFVKLRWSSQDFQSFGLFSKWAPYIPEVKRFVEYLVNQLIYSEVSSLSQEPVGSKRVLSGNSLHLAVGGMYSWQALS